MSRQSVMGVFEYEDDLIRAAQKLKDSGFEGLEFLSPVPIEHELEKVFGARKSAVRRYSLAGALLGAIGGFSLAVFSALAFILPTGGRPVIAFPPFFVITYEMTILLGVLATLFGFHMVSGLPAWRDAPYKPEFNVDRFGVIVPIGTSDQGERAEGIIRAAGAEEVSQVEGR